MPIFFTQYTFGNKFFRIATTTFGTMTTKYCPKDREYKQKPGVFAFLEKATTIVTYISTITALHTNEIL